jgi:hypothetical protein
MAEREARSQVGIATFRSSTAILAAKQPSEPTAELKPRTSGGAALDLVRGDARARCVGVHERRGYAHRIDLSVVRVVDDRRVLAAGSVCLGDGDTTAPFTAVHRLENRLIIEARQRPRPCCNDSPVW